MWATLLTKLPFLGRLTGFLTSGRFLAFLAAIIIAIFLFTQGVSFVTRYVEQEVTQKVELSVTKKEAAELKHQIDVMKNNQQVVTQVVKETRVIQQKHAEKAAKIEEKINEQVKDGNDGYTGDITSSVLDSL